jgi:hypothetical protein
MRRTVRWLPVAAALVMAVPAPVHAQFGGLLKKAKQAAEQQNQNPDARPSSAFGPEFTEQTMTAVLNGLAAEEQVLVQRNTLAKQRDDLLDQRGKLVDAHSAEQTAYEQALDKHRECVQQALEQSDEARHAKINAYAQTMAADPTKLARGDTAGAARATLAPIATQAGVSMDFKADTAQALRQCGPPPARAGWMVTADADRTRADSLAAQMRTLENEADAQALQVSGLPATQFAQLRERMVNWYRGGRDKNSVQQFSSAELKLFHEHQAQIEKLDLVL